MTPFKTNVSTFDEVRNALEGVVANLKAVEAAQATAAAEIFHGEVTLSAGAATVTDSRVTAATWVHVTRKTANGTIGHLRCLAGAGSFTINSSSGSEASVLRWSAFN